MTAGRLIFPGFMPCEDSNGDRVAGAKAYFYIGTTTTLATTYTDDTLTVENANPVVADSVGTWPQMWADTATLFSVSLTDSSGAPLPDATWSGLSAAIDATLASVALSLAAQVAAEAAEAGAQAAQLLAEAAAASITGEPFQATSSSSNTIGVGLKTFGLNQPGTLFQEGQTVVSAKTGAAENQMTGIITAVAVAVDGKQTITFDVPAGAHAEPGGVGPYATWTISLSAIGAVVSVAGLTGAISAAALKTALAIASTDVTDFNTAVDARATTKAAAFAVAL